MVGDSILSPAVAAKGEEPAAAAWPNSELNEADRES